MINSLNSFMLDKKSQPVLMKTQVSTPVATPKQLPVEKEKEINYGKIFIGIGLAAVAVIGGVFALLHAKKRSNDLIKSKNDFIKMQNDLIKLQESDILHHKAHQDEINKLLQETEVLKQQIKILLGYEAKEVELQRVRGLNRIAGYDEDKKFIRDSFIEPFRRSFESTSNKGVPNVLLLYGPSANGKTTFANGIIEELRQLTKTKYYDLSTETPDSIIPKLEEIIEQAATKFKQSHTRTLVYIDEFSKIRTNPNNDRSLKTLVDNCAESGITLVTTTINPNAVERILSEGKGIKILIGTPSREDIAKIFEYYLGGLTQGDVNWQEIAKLLEENAQTKNIQYSCSEIEALTKKIKDLTKKELRYVTQQDITAAVGKFQTNLI